MKLERVQVRQQELAAYEGRLQVEMAAAEANRFKLDQVPDAGNPVFFPQGVS